MDNIVAKVENRLNDATWTAIDNLMMPRAELAMGSVNASSKHCPESVVKGLDQRDFSMKMEGTPHLNSAN